MSWVLLWPAVTSYINVQELNYSINNTYFYLLMNGKFIIIVFYTAQIIIYIYVYNIKKSIIHKNSSKLKNWIISKMRITDNSFYDIKVFIFFKYALCSTNISLCFKEKSIINRYLKYLLYAFMNVYDCKENWRIHTTVTIYTCQLTTWHRIYIHLVS